MSEFNIEIGDLSEKDRAERKGYPVKIKLKFKKMKIEINAEQTIDEVCKELENKGYKPLNICSISPIHNWIVVGGVMVLCGVGLMHLKFQKFTSRLTPSSNCEK